ncbi:hypothetical protein ES703_117033 [subsurface metagenome]
MALASPRADNLNIICDLAWLVSEGEIYDPPSFRMYTTTRQLMNGFKPWKRTRQYHYISALRDLKLVNLAGKEAELTNKGFELAKTVCFGYLQPRKLCQSEKEFLRAHLLSYTPFVKFLGRFLLTSRKFSSYKQLQTGGGILIFEKDRQSGIEVMIRPDGQAEILSPNMVYEIKWTLKNWCKDLSIIDELFLEYTFNHIGNRHRRIFFPLKLDAPEISLDDFKARIDSLLSSGLYNGSHVRIPLLMYDFCTKYYFPVRGFHLLLGKLYQNFPSKYRLEKVSSLSIDERPHRINGYTNYPKIDASYRYSLVIK